MEGNDGKRERVALEKKVSIASEMDESIAREREESICAAAKTMEQIELQCAAEEPAGPSNQLILAVTSVGFTVFVIAEIAGAFASGSLSLLGDAAAMSVDVFTYICNMYAEHVKGKGEEITNNGRLIMEVYIPSFSVCALIGVTIYITQDALSELSAPRGDDDEDVNVVMLWVFSCSNALVDVLSFAMFYISRETAFRYNNIEHGVEMGPTVASELHDRQSVDGMLKGSDTDFECESHDTMSNGEFRVDCEADGNYHIDEEERLNLNMTSAFTHVGGDTLRTISVFIAAFVATVTGIRGSVCDAWAAVIVSVTIVAIVIPLIKEIYKAYNLEYEPQVLTNTNLRYR